MAKLNHLKRYQKKWETKNNYCLIKTVPPIIQGVGHNDTKEKIKQIKSSHMAARQILSI
jgi:hypothetical protein